MLNLGQNWEEVHWPDNWTATTIDGRRSAQFEETLLSVAPTSSFLKLQFDLGDSITETGVEVLTAGKPREDLQ
jgi:methionyl aminopeptidase